MFSPCCLATSLLLLHHAGLGPASKLLHLQFPWNTLTRDHALLSSAVTSSESHRQLTRSSPPYSVILTPQCYYTLPAEHMAPLHDASYFNQMI